MTVVIAVSPEISKVGVVLFDDRENSAEEIRAAVEKWTNHQARFTPGIEVTFISGNGSDRSFWFEVFKACDIKCACEIQDILQIIATEVADLEKRSETILSN